MNIFIKSNSLPRPLHYEIVNRRYLFVGCLVSAISRHHEIPLTAFTLLIFRIADVNMEKMSLKRNSKCCKLKQLFHLDKISFSINLMEHISFVLNENILKTHSPLSTAPVHLFILPGRSSGRNNLSFGTSCRVSCAISLYFLPRPASLCVFFQQVA